jgi:hypothetical protein
VTDHLTAAEVLAIHADQIETRRRFPWRQRPRAAGSRPLPAADRLFTRPDRGSRRTLGEPVAEPCLHRPQQAHGLRRHGGSMPINRQFPGAAHICQHHLFREVQRPHAHTKPPVMRGQGVRSTRSGSSRNRASRSKSPGNRFRVPRPNLEVATFSDTADLLTGKPTGSP